MQHPGQHQRDDGMNIVKQATTWLAVGGVAATGLFAGVSVASNAGHATVTRKVPVAGTPATGSTPTTGATPTTATTGATPATGPTSSTTAPASTQQFQAPATPPANANSGGGSVVSGGS